MCDPVTIAGVALSGLSTGLNYAAQSKVQGARDDAMAAERIRQNGLDREADAINLRSQDRYQNFEEKQTERGSQLGDYFTEQAVAEPTAGETMPASGSNITVAEEAKQRGAARAFTNEVGTARGKLRAFGDVLGSIGREQAQDANLIGQIGGFKRGSSGVLGLELDSANSAGDGLKLFGDIAAGLGSVASAKGAMNRFENANPMTSPNTYGSTGSVAVGRAVDRASVPGYAGYAPPRSSFFSFFRR